MPVVFLAGIQCFKFRLVQFNTLVQLDPGLKDYRGDGFNSLHFKIQPARHAGSVLSRYPVL